MQVSVSDYLLKIHLAVKFEGAAVMDNEVCSLYAYTCTPTPIVLFCSVVLFQIRR